MAAWAALAAIYLALATWGTVSLASGIFVQALTRGSREHPEVALTFDDGPDPLATPALLDLLRERKAACAFFWVGELVRAHPEIARRAAQEGHLLGNHSHRHSFLTNFFWGGALRRELAACQAAIAAAAGSAPRYYRPPFGLVNHAVQEATMALGLEVVGWEARGFDTTAASPDAVVARILRRVRPGGIILLHDGGQEPARVVEITSRLLDGLKDQGLAPVRLDRLRGRRPAS